MPEYPYHWELSKIFRLLTTITQEELSSVFTNSKQLMTVIEGTVSTLQLFKRHEATLERLSEVQKSWIEVLKEACRLKEEMRSFVLEEKFSLYEQNGRLTQNRNVGIIEFEEYLSGLIETASRAPKILEDLRIGQAIENSEMVIIHNLLVFVTATGGEQKQEKIQELHEWILALNNLDIALKDPNNLEMIARLYELINQDITTGHDVIKASFRAALFTHGLLNYTP